MDRLFSAVFHFHANGRAGDLPSGYHQRHMEAMVQHDDMKARQKSDEAEREERREREKKKISEGDVVADNL